MLSPLLHGSVGTHRRSVDVEHSEQDGYGRLLVHSIQRTPSHRQQEDTGQRGL